MSVASKEKTELTDFPKKGDDQKITLKNSEYPQFDYDYVKDLKDNWPEIWDLAGNVGEEFSGDKAFEWWGEARGGSTADDVTEWIWTRERWMARHSENVNLEGVIAVAKWAGIVDKGEAYMKELIDERKELVERRRENKSLNPEEDNSQKPLAEGALLAYAAESAHTLCAIGMMLFDFAGSSTALVPEMNLALSRFCADAKFLSGQFDIASAQQNDVARGLLNRNLKSIHARQEGIFGPELVELMKHDIEQSMNTLNKLYSYEGGSENVENARKFLGYVEEAMSWFWDTSDQIIEAVDQYGSADWWWEMASMFSIDAQKGPDGDILVQSLKSTLVERRRAMLERCYKMDGEVNERGEQKYKSIFMPLQPGIDTFEGEVTGIVMPAGTPDRTYLDGDYFSEDIVRECLLYWAVNSPMIDLQHDRPNATLYWENPHFTVVENWQARTDFVLGGQPVLKGDWLMTIRAISEEGRLALRDGKFKGFSVEVWAAYYDDEVLARPA